MNLAAFDNSAFDRGASRGRECAWLLAQALLFRHGGCYRLRRTVLRRFGGWIAPGVIVKPGAKVTFPWKLVVGDNSWIGEEAWLLNLEQITIGSNVCISQRAFLCTGSHDWSKPSFDLIVKPIVIGEGVWICANVFVGPGVTIGKDSVVTAGSVVTSDLPEGMVCSGNPAAPVKPRGEKTEANREIREKKQRECNR